MQNLTPKDIELIEKIIYKNIDDIAVSIARVFERLQDNMEATESRLYGRITDIEDKIQSNLNVKDIELITEALEISASVKVYGEGREEHQKECRNVINKLTNK